MFIGHYNDFNDAINNVKLSKQERDSMLYYEGEFYRLANEYADKCNDLESGDLDRLLSRIRWHVNVIMEYLNIKLDADCVMYEAIDVIFATRRELAS